MKKRILLLVLLTVISLIAYEVYCKNFTAKEYFEEEAYNEFQKINASDTMFAVKGYGCGRIFIIGDNGVVKAFNTGGFYTLLDENDKPTFDIENTDCVYQCREWRLSPTEYIVLNLRLKRARTDNEDFKLLYYSGRGSLYLRYKDKEYTCGGLLSLIEHSEETKNYALRFSQLIETLTKMELCRYDKPMMEDDAWRERRPIKDVDNRIVNNELYWEN